MHTHFSYVTTVQRAQERDMDVCSELYMLVFQTILQ